MACKHDGKEETHLEGAYVRRQAVAHDRDELRMDLVLVLLVVLVNQRNVSAIALFRMRWARTRLSLSNSMSITACFWLKCLRNVSRIYGMSEIMIAKDCDARAAVRPHSLSRLASACKHAAHGHSTTHPNASP